LLLFWLICFISVVIVLVDLFYLVDDMTYGLKGLRFTVFRH